MRLLALLLLAALTNTGGHLSAQQTVVVPDVVNTINVDPTPIEITVEALPLDSAAVARDEAAQRAMDAIAEYLATCGCVDSGPTNVSIATNVGLTLAAFFIGWQLKRIADRDPDVHTTDVDVNVPEHDDHGEGRGHD